ncbi:MAG: c-type cytochrome [Verrucomicrobiota bacterium]
MKTHTRIAFVFAALLLGKVTLLAGDATAGKALYNTCLACHGMNGEGNPALKSPAVNNLSEKYIIAQLEKFANKQRGADPKDVAGITMAPMAMMVPTPEAKANVAAYIATLEGPKPPATLTGGNPEKGKVLYATCAACHGPDGKGMDQLNAPSLVNQHDWYQLTQLKNFKDGIRGAHPQDITGATMRPMAMMLTDEQAMKDVIAYLQSLE